MWNEFMEWEEDPDEKITFYSNEEYERIINGYDPNGQPYHQQSNDDFEPDHTILGLALAGFAIVSGAIICNIAEKIIDYKKAKDKERKDNETT